jgi:uncharacterized membrane protein
MNIGVISLNEGNFQAPPPPPSAGPTPPPPPPETPTPGGTGQNDTLMLILSYFPNLCLPTSFLCLVPFFAEKDNNFVQFHAKQGLVFSLAELIFWILFYVLNVILGIISLGVLSVLFSLLGLLIYLGILGYRIYLMVKSCNGEKITIPFISTYSERWFK